MKVVRVIRDHHHTITKDQRDNMIDQPVKIRIHVTIPRTITLVLRTLWKMSGIRYEIVGNDQLHDRIHTNSDSKLLFMK